LGEFSLASEALGKPAYSGRAINKLACAIDCNAYKRIAKQTSLLTKKTSHYCKKNSKKPFLLVATMPEPHGKGKKDGEYLNPKTPSFLCLIGDFFLILGEKKKKITMPVLNCIEHLTIRPIFASAFGLLKLPIVRRCRA
jgi:hypothetical protein